MSQFFKNMPDEHLNIKDLKDRAKVAIQRKQYLKAYKLLKRAKNYKRGVIFIGDEMHSLRNPIVIDIWDNLKFQRSKSFKFKVAIQECNPDTFDPFKKMYTEEFKNPFSHEETLERLKHGGFESLYEFFDVVSKVKAVNRELFKKWWLEDGSKAGALDIINNSK